MNWDKERGLQVSGDCPDDETIGLLLHNLRPFILNDEKSFLPKVSNLISKEIDNTWIRDLLKDIKYLWSGGALSGMVQITMTMESDGQKVQEKILTDNFLNKWLNAYEYHLDSDKRSLIEGLHKYYPMEGTKSLLVGLLLEKVKAIYRLSEFIDHVMSDKPIKSLNFSIGIGKK